MTQEQQDTLIEQTSQISYLSNLVLALIEQTSNESKDKNVYLQSILDLTKRNNDLSIENQKNAIAQEFEKMYAELPEYQMTQENKSIVEQSIKESQDEIFPKMKNIFDVNVEQLDKTFDYFLKK